MSMLIFDKVKTVLLDIEGTVCPISFVKEVLFPYALDALPTVLQSKWDDPDFKPYRDAFPEGARQSPQAMEAEVKQLTASDVKVSRLKNLQGYLWTNGYESGALSAPLFPDVLPQLQHWHTQGIQLAIYSSGSISAQRLLFRHVATQEGQLDTTPLLSAYFDTTNAGKKTESASYTAILKALGRSAEEVLFLSDVPAEVSAARIAGMAAVIVQRAGNAPVTKEEAKDFWTVQTLAEVHITDPSAK